MLTTYDVVKAWFDSLAAKDYEAYYGLIDDDIEWVNLRAVEGVSDCLPWLGTLQGKAAVLRSYEVFAQVAAVDPESFVLHGIHVDGENAVAHLHEEMVVHHNGARYSVDGAFLMRVRNGKVVRWESFWDPSGAVRAVTSEGSRR